MGAFPGRTTSSDLSWGWKLTLKCRLDQGRYFNSPPVRSQGKVAAIRGEGENKRGRRVREKEGKKERRSGDFWNEAPVCLRLARTGLFPGVRGFRRFKVILVVSNAHNLLREVGWVGYDVDALTQAWTCSQRTGWMDGIYSYTHAHTHTRTHTWFKQTLTESRISN